MVIVEVGLNKSIEQSAALYFERAKKAKHKLDGARLALEKARKDLVLAEKSKDDEYRKLKDASTPPTGKHDWYEKFRWFFSSEGFLCIGGRDATTNEILIKKHTEPDDVVFHTKMEGSPFFIVKSDGKIPGDATLQEAAQATGIYSRAWRLGLPGIETFYVRPEQVSKSAPSGEYLTKGAFVIKGSMSFIQAQLQLAIGISEGRIIGGPVNAIRKNSERSVIIAQGKEATSQVAKQVQKKIGGTVDEIIKFIPAGGVKLQK
jgi:predicted ribosome quality control (RQC) complex YloA/Tae2 family protein